MSTTQTRVIASKPKIGTRPVGPGADAPQDEPGAPRGRKKLLVVVLTLLLVGGAGGWWFLMGPGSTDSTVADGGTEADQEGAAPAGRPEGEPGDVLTTDAISINLAEGHYLRLGLGLELNATPKNDISPAKALDAAIELFSGRPVSEVASVEGRAALKDELVQQLWRAYDGDVLDVYFTDFVTQ